MTTTMYQIENLVGLIRLRQSGARTPTEFEQYSDEDLAKMLCHLAVAHLDQTTEGVEDGS